MKINTCEVPMTKVITSKRKPFNISCFLSLELSVDGRFPATLRTGFLLSSCKGCIRTSPEDTTSGFDDMIRALDGTYSPFVRELLLNIVASLAIGSVYLHATCVITCPLAMHECLHDRLLDTSMRIDIKILDQSGKLK